MFDQTFVNGRMDEKKPFAILLSLLLQIAVMGVLTVLPLIYSEALPSAQLKNTLIAPPAPPPPPRPHPDGMRARNAPAHLFIVPKLLAPKTIPTQVNDIKDAVPNVATGVSGSAGLTEQAPNGVIASILGEPSSAPPIVAAPKAPPHSGPVRIGGRVAEANLVRKIQPAYPPLAKSARVQGTVEFTATISKEGRIENLQLVRGHPLLVNAAREAVLQWTYRPTLLNGSPVEVVTDIVVNFTLNP